MRHQYRQRRDLRRHALTMVGAAVLVLAQATAAWGDPPIRNDSFRRAAKIRTIPFSHTQDTTGATEESNEPQPCAGIAATVWFKFTPNANLTLQADTVGSDYDTAVAVYTGDSIESLTLVACNDDSEFGLQSKVVFDASAGVTYRFQVGGFIGQTGNLTFNLAEGVPPPPPPPPPANDNFVDATQIQALPFSTTQETIHATLEAGEPLNCSMGSASVWYRLTQGATPQTLTADTFGSNYDTVLAVYEDTDGTMSGLSLVGCNDDAAFPVVLQSQVSWLALPGVTYYLQIGGFDGVGGGSLTLNVQ